MKNELLAPLHFILNSADALMVDTDGVLNALQSKFVMAIHTDAAKLYELLVSTPDLSWDRARALLDFETRQHLASIIGYAEVLLEEVEGDLSGEQREHVHNIRAGGKLLLDRLAHEG